MLLITHNAGVPPSMGCILRPVGAIFMKAVEKQTVDFLLTPSPHLTQLHRPRCPAVNDPPEQNTTVKHDPADTRRVTKLGKYGYVATQSRSCSLLRGDPTKKLFDSHFGAAHQLYPLARLARAVYDASACSTGFSWVYDDVRQDSTIQAKN